MTFLLVFLVLGLVFIGVGLRLIGAVLWMSFSLVRVVLFGVAAALAWVWLVLLTPLAALFMIGSLARRPYYGPPRYWRRW